MARFKHYDYNQTSMVVINYQDQLQPGSFEYALHYLISEKLNLSAFHHTLQPVLETIQERYKRLGISKNFYKEDIVVTADTGFANDKFVGNKFEQLLAGPQGERVSG
tara:strand:- start:3601 stop:3921 length:321 start_codon:yes stop_codon:yes gene_type:complete